MPRACQKSFFIFLVGSFLIGFTACRSSEAVDSKLKPMAEPPDDPRPQPKGNPSAKIIRNFENFRFPAAERIVAIGDLHGDFNATLRAFALAGAIHLPQSTEPAPWVGGKLVIVQTGDQLDRGDGELQILRFLKRIKREARAAGGAVHVLNGNHETMNAMGDFRYVTPVGFQAFQDVTSPSPLVQRFDKATQGRAAAFLPRGPWAEELAKQPLVIQVGTTLFAHGGVLPAHLEYGIDRMNRETAQWLKGVQGRPPAVVLSPEGPLWTRQYGSARITAQVCARLKKVLQLAHAQLLVVGHTVQPGGVNFACSKQLARIDVGLSAHYAGPQVSLLEIRGEALKVIEAPLPRKSN